MMRTALVTPSKDSFLILIDDPHLLKRGGALSDITTFQSPILYQKGAGLFSFLKGIGRRAMPFIMKNVAPKAFDMGKGVLDDVTSGKVKLRDFLKSRGIKAFRGVARRATMRGGGRIQKKKENAVIIFYIYKNRCIHITEVNRFIACSPITCL